MTEQNQISLPVEVLNTILTGGLDGLSEAVSLLINHAMLIERHRHLRADDPTLPDRIHLRTLVEHGLAPMLKREPLDILRQMLGDELPPEPVFVNLTVEQLERCIQASQRALSPAPEPEKPEPPELPFRDRLALSSEEGGFVSSRARYPPFGVAMCS